MDLAIFIIVMILFIILFGSAVWIMCQFCCLNQSSSYYSKENEPQDKKGGIPNIIVLRNVKDASTETETNNLTDVAVQTVIVTKELSPIYKNLDDVDSLLLRSYPNEKKSLSPKVILKNKNSQHQERPFVPSIRNVKFEDRISIKEDVDGYYTPEEEEETS